MVDKRNTPGSFPNNTNQNRSANSAQQPAGRPNLSLPSINGAAPSGAAQRSASHARSARPNHAQTRQGQAPAPQMSANQNGWPAPLPVVEPISSQDNGIFASQQGFSMPPEKKKGGTIYRIIMLLAGIMFVVCIGLLAYQLLPYLQESKTSDSVRSSFIVKEANEDAEEGAEDEFPVIDWDALLETNPDVIGWILVPGTNINYAICADKADYQDFYLHHDLYGEESVYGVPYLDATCNTDWTSPNSLVFGHHLFSKDMFTAFSDFEDEAYFNKHRTILLMTPEKNMKLNAVMVNVVNGYTEQRTTEFDSKKDFLSYWNEQREASEVIAKDAPEKPSQVFCFVTCESDSTSDNRVMVYAVDVTANDAADADADADADAEGEATDK